MFAEHETKEKLCIILYIGRIPDKLHFPFLFSLKILEFVREKIITNTKFFNQTKEKFRRKYYIKIQGKVYLQQRAISNACRLFRLFQEFNI